MAKSPNPQISEEELQLRKRARRRLIGAIALVLIAAVFLPMLLEHEPKPSGDNIDVQIPAPDNVAVPAETTATSAPEAAITPASAPVAAAPTATPAEVKAIGKPAEAKKTETKKTEVKKVEAKPAAKPAEKIATTEAGAYVVQVAALADSGKAMQMRDQIKTAGVAVYTETVATVSGKVTRVRAGPFKTKEEAEKAQTKLKGIGLNGNVVPK